MLPVLVGNAELPSFMTSKKYIDLRSDYYQGITKIAGFIHGISEYRVNEAISSHSPQNLEDVWRLLISIGWHQCIVLGKDDFDEVVSCGAGTKLREDYATYYPDKIMQSVELSPHLKQLFSEIALYSTSPSK